MKHSHSHFSILVFHLKDSFEDIQILLFIIAMMLMQMQMLTLKRLQNAHAMQYFNSPKKTSINPERSNLKRSPHFPHHLWSSTLAHHWRSNLARSWWMSNSAAGWLGNRRSR
jgi:hypothetical protein